MDEGILNNGNVGNKNAFGSGTNTTSDGNNSGNVQTGDGIQVTHAGDVQTGNGTQVTGNNNAVGSPDAIVNNTGDGVASGDGRAQNVEDHATAAQDNGLAQGGQDNTNVIVTDPNLQFGRQNANANNGSIALSADAIAQDTGKAQDNSNGGMGAMDQAVVQNADAANNGTGVAQSGQVNLNNLAAAPIPSRSGI